MCCVCHHDRLMQGGEWLEGSVEGWSEGSGLRMVDVLVNLMRICFFLG